MYLNLFSVCSTVPQLTFHPAGVHYSHLFRHPPGFLLKLQVLQ
jgi:hypothetical protein